MEDADFDNLAEQVGRLVGQWRQWREQNAALRAGLEEQASRVKALEAENSDLRQNLESVDTGDGDGGLEKKLLESRQQYAPNLVIRDYKENGENPGSVPYEHYTHLAKRYENLFSENSGLIESFFTLKKRLKSCKEKVSSWNNCFERDAFDVYVHGKKVVFQRADTISLQPSLNQSHSGRLDRASEPAPTTSWPSDDGTEFKSSEGDVTQHGGSDPESPTLPTQNSRAKRQPDDSPSNFSDLASTQSQDPRCAVETRMFPISSSPRTPVVVSERPVGRRNHREPLHPTIITLTKPTETGSFNRPVAVKSEPPSSSPPENVLSIINDYQAKSRSNELENHDNMAPEPIRHTPLRPQNCRFAVFSDRDVSNPGLSSVGEQQLTSGTKRRAALQPVDNNAVIAHRPEENTPNRSAKRRRYDPRGAEAVPLIAEDGDIGEERYSRSKGHLTPAKLQVNSKPENAKSPAHSRLEDLLGSVPRPKPRLSITPQKGSGASSPKPASPMPERGRGARPRQSEGDGMNDVSARKTPLSDGLRGSIPTRNSPAGDYFPSPENEPLRARPLHRLGFEHFKLNPDRNQGLDYAFDEVVRRKSLRKCLPGCVRPECCGQGFRAMARLKGFGTADGKETVSLEYLDQEDRQVLDEYLGNNKGVLKTMTEKELRELLLDARTRHFANQFGKHRHAHDRARSPPGFWRTDMPSTQELERDRKEAEKAEQEKLAEIYREAMRPDGLWKFADE
ncbi:hypothetical protein FQN53_005177 [Emmonsiellopsis sp. PD_33]|nr:hypothetical protein FQN53_005177 [Emmonsiellopsis sp. PD_33]KAK2793440.1 hypothetical protein FQN51_001266 [Onygenales sp. PD_10]